jgi:hypothetical protein
LLKAAKIGATPSTAALTGVPDSTGPPAQPALPLPALGDDLLRGALEIALFVFGKAGPKERRRVYWLDAIGALPTFRMGAIICARRSTITRDILQREARAAELSAQT